MVLYGPVKPCIASNIPGKSCKLLLLLLMLLLWLYLLLLIKLYLAVINNCPSDPPKWYHWVSVVGGGWVGWGLHSHFHVKPNYCWGCVGVLQIQKEFHGSDNWLLLLLLQLSPSTSLDKSSDKMHLFINYLKNYISTGYMPSLNEMNAFLKTRKLIMIWLTNNSRSCKALMAIIRKH